MRNVLFGIVLIASSMLLSMNFYSTTEKHPNANKIKMEKVLDATTEPVTISIDTEEYIDTFVEFKMEEEPVEQTYSLSDEEIDLLALLVMAESEGECEEGQRLVIDVVLNRVDSEYFPNTVTEVIYQSNQFTSMWNNRVNRCEVQEHFRELVIEELESRTNYDVIFFRAGKYSKYGTPLFSIENHYFSSY